MLVTLLGIVTEVSPLQTKVRFPMLVTLLGIAKSVISTSSKHRWRAYNKGLEKESPNT